MSREEREKKAKVLAEKVSECAAKYQDFLEKKTIEHMEEITNLRIAENQEMLQIKKDFVIPAPVTHKIFRGDINSLKEGIKNKWNVTAFQKEVSEKTEISDKNGCLNPELLRKPFCFEYIALEE